jgi:hypothetical protein
VATRNIVGDVPLEWYKDEEHIGYDIEGRKIKKRDREGRIEAYIRNADEDKNWYGLSLLCCSHLNQLSSILTAIQLMNDLALRFAADLSFEMICLVVGNLTGIIYAGK